MTVLNKLTDITDIIDNAQLQELCAIKKRVALGNFLFNTVTAAILFFFLQPLNDWITEGLQIKDNLIALVLFQSAVNLGCILLFLPFLNPFGKFLMTRFPDKQDETFPINKVSVHDTDLASEVLENETKRFITCVIDYSLDSFNLKESLKQDQPAQKKFHNKTVTEKYDYIKQLHGEMHGFYLKLQHTKLSKTETKRVNQLISAHPEWYVCCKEYQGYSA